MVFFKKKSKNKVRTSVPTITVPLEYATNLICCSKIKLPQNTENMHSQKIIFEMVKKCFHIEDVMLSVSVQQALNKEEIPRECNSVIIFAAEVGYEINGWLSHYNHSTVFENLKSKSDEDLLFSLAALSYYAEKLKDEYKEGIKQYILYISQIMYDRGYDNTASVTAHKKLTESEGIDYINALSKVYVVCSSATGENYPSLDTAGYAWVFSKAEFADCILNKNSFARLNCQELSLPEFKAFVKEWYKYGACRFKLNPGIDDVQTDIDRDNFVPNIKAKQFDYYGSSLNQEILRMKQMKAIKTEDAQRYAATFWSAVCNHIYDTVFLVPVSYDDEPDDAVDGIIHYTDDGIKQLNNIQLKRIMGEESNNNVRIESDSIIAKEELIPGSEGYKFASAETAKQGRTMHLRSISNGASSFLCGFTDIGDIHKIFGKNVHIALFTYNEIIEHIESTLSDGNKISGFIINAGANELILNREDIAFAEKEHIEGIKVYI